MVQETAEAFADDTPLVNLFGKPARVRILSVMVDERKNDLSISEIARQAGVARSTVYDHLDYLLDLGVINHTRTSGASERYQLNPESQIGELLYQLDGVVLRRQLELRDDVDLEE